MSDLNAAAEESGDKPRREGGGHMLAGKRCLVVDDELLIALDIQQELEGAGAAEVVCAGAFGDALKALEGAPFHLVVLDVQLGRAGGAGIAIAKALAVAGTPFLFLTGGRADAPEVAVFGVPVVEKPFLPALLMAAVAKALAGRA
jgi:DNA-binding response OmpR family regulator